MCPLVYVVEQIGTRSREKVNCTRLLLYEGCLDGENVPEDVLGPAERIEAKYQTLEKIVDIGLEDTKISLQL